MTGEENVLSVVASLLTVLDVRTLVIGFVKVVLPTAVVVVVPVSVVISVVVATVDPVGVQDRVGVGVGVEVKVEVATAVEEAVVVADTVVVVAVAKRCGFCCNFRYVAISQETRRYNAESVFVLF